MKKSDARGVFFDCWNTVITFCEKDKNWNVLPLINHCINNENINWDEVKNFSAGFFREYYPSRLNFEINGLQYLNLMVTMFGIKLNCSLETCYHEILSGLDPEPVEGIKQFLSFLKEKGIYFAILSNTIYSDEDTLKIIDRLIPDNGFGFFFGSASVGVKKPNPWFFQAGVIKAGFKPEDCIYIGDAFYQDAYGSYQSGFAHSIWLNWKHESNERHLKLIDKPFEYTEVSSYQELMERMNNGTY